LGAQEIGAEIGNAHMLSDFQLVRLLKYFTLLIFISITCQKKQMLDVYHRWSTLRGGRLQEHSGAHRRHIQQAFPYQNAIFGFKKILTTKVAYTDLALRGL